MLHTPVTVRKHFHIHVSRIDKLLSNESELYHDLHFMNAWGSNQQDNGKHMHEHNVFCTCTLFSLLGLSCVLRRVCSVQCASFRITQHIDTIGEILAWFLFPSSNYIIFLYTSIQAIYGETMVFSSKKEQEEESTLSTMIRRHLDINIDELTISGEVAISNKQCLHKNAQAHRKQLEVCYYGFSKLPFRWLLFDATRIHSCRVPSMKQLSRILSSEDWFILKNAPLRKPIEDDIATFSRNYPAQPTNNHLFKSLTLENGIVNKTTSLMTLNSSNTINAATNDFPTITSELIEQRINFFYSKKSKIYIAY